MTMDACLPASYDAALLPPSCFAPDPEPARCVECGGEVGEGERTCAACAPLYANDCED